MAEVADYSEDIGSFLTRLKLPAKYLDNFKDNGYHTVKDCEELRENDLKGIGISLAGHLRRILNKLPRSSPWKPVQNLPMDSLLPTTDSDDAQQRSPGLQYLPLNTERTAEAHLEHPPLGQNLSLPSPEIWEDLTFNDTNMISENFWSDITMLQSRPLTPPPLEYFEGEENPSQDNFNILPSPPTFTEDDGFEEMPLPSMTPPPPPEEDPYLFSLPTSKAKDENPYLSETPAKPSDEYDFLHEGVCAYTDTYNFTANNVETGEDDYDHIKSDIQRSIPIPQSPNSISTAVATIFSRSPPLHDSSESLDEGAVECVYDRLDSNLPQSPRKEFPLKISTSLLTPPQSCPGSRKPSTDVDDITGSRLQLHRTQSGESAKNLPLPPPPWKAVIDDNPVIKTEEPEKQRAVLAERDSHSSVPDESDYWAGDMERIEDSNKGGEYDTLSLTRSGKYDPRAIKLRSAHCEDEESRSLDYEVVGYPSRETSSPKIGMLGQLPPVPHNTPSHTLDDPEEFDNEQCSASYEEVEFLPPEKRNYPVTSETAIYSGTHDIDRERSMTMHSQRTKSKKLGVRRLTGVQAQLQKAAQSAKAVITRKPGRKSKMGDSRSTSFSDNDSEGSLSSRKSSIDAINKSLEDLTCIPDLPPTYPGRHQKHPNDTLPSGIVSAGKSASLRAPALTRMSPVTRRKRADAHSYGELERSYVQESLETGIYEEFSPIPNDSDEIPKPGHTGQGKTKDRKLHNESGSHPVKAPRQRPLSVFTDSPKYPQEGLSVGQDERSRTYSATLKRGIPANSIPQPTSGKDEYMDVTEFLRAYQTPQVIPVSPLTKKRTKSGWLWKQGGHEGRAPLRKRWAVFDGDELAYYESETKTEFSKGILPVEVMNRLQVPPSSQTIFHLQMKGGRTFIFQAESSDERTMWTSTFMAAMLTLQQKGVHQLKPGGNMYMPYKEGALKLDGVRQKVYVAIKGDQAVYYKSKNEFMFAQPISRLQMKLATVKDIGNRKFQVIFPYRTFTFTADSEEEKKSWIDALQDAIAEGLSDYQVLNEIWVNESNKKCADCGRAFPDWASINLAIIVCKHCAGVHRELGVHNSKVRSLKMDIRIWDSRMKRLLIDIGNEEANKFWQYNLNSSDGITDMADKNQRSWFIKSKYIDMDYVLDRREGDKQDLLNKSLIDAVRADNLVEAYHLTFSGADINCFTGKEHAKTPHLLAEHLTYTTLAEFLRQNGGTSVTSPQGHITDRNTSVRKKNSIPKTRSKPPVCLRDCLYKYGGDFKNTGEDTKTKGKLNLIISALQPGDFQKRLCVLENNTLKYCDPEKPNVVKDSLSCSDLISVTVHAPEQAVKAGYKHCFELSRTSGRTYLFCADREETRIRWTRGLMQEIVPTYIQDAMQTEEEYERIGKIKIKAKLWSKSDTQWTTTWCRLRKKKLQYYHSESRAMETIDLRKLVQIAVDQTRETKPTQANGLQNKDAIPIIMLVFRDKSYYIHSDTRQDTDSWMAAIRRADNESGTMLVEKQLTAEGVPIVLEKCITYVEQFGIATRGIYRLSGTHSKTTQLLSDFQQNARETQMREGQMNVHDVANALKRWFKSLPGSLLTEPLHDQWIETVQIRAEHHGRKLEWYKHLLEKLPDINRVTLKVLLNHLKNVSNLEKQNEMSLHNLAIVFGPTLMEPQEEDGTSEKYLGQTSQEIACVEDLLQYYDWLFDVTDTDREKEQRMQLAKEKMNQATQQQNMLTTMDYDMMVPIYIHRKEDRCVNYKVNLTAEELITKVCKTHGYPPEKWAIYEVVMDGDVERPLHYTEHVLSVIKSWNMPSLNYLLAKNDYVRDKMKWFKQIVPADTEIIMEAQLRYYEGKKKWPKVTGCLAKNVQDGSFYFKYFKTPSKPAVSLNVSSFNVYVGVDKKTKPPGNGRQGFTIIQAGESPKYFIADTEGELFRWISNILLSMHPEGYTPPPTQENSPSKSQDDSEQQKRSDPRPGHYGIISQQELGAQIAARVVNLQRTSSNESTGSMRERFLDPGQHGTSPAPYTPSTQQNNSPSPIILEDSPLEESVASLEDLYEMPRPRLTSTGSVDFATRPNQLTTDGHGGRPMLHHPLSPVDPRNQHRAGIGHQLHDELSNVLRRKRAQ